MSKDDDQEDHDDVAVKYMESQTDKETIKNEIKILRWLKHENIITFYCYTNDFGLVMELANDGNVNDVLETVDPSQWSLGLILSWLNQTAQAILYLHQFKPKAIIHRDIKPSHLLVKNMCRTVKLTGFGTACHVDTPIDHMPLKTGSVKYMAPEVMISNSFTVKCDVFSWAYTFGEIAIAKESSSKSNDINSEQLINQSIKLTKFPSKVENLIRQCLDPRPENRLSIVEIEKIMSELSYLYGSPDLEPIRITKRKTILDEIFTMNAPYPHWFKPFSKELINLTNKYISHITYKSSPFDCFTKPFLVPSDQLSPTFIHALALERNRMTHNKFVPPPLPPKDSKYKKIRRSDFNLTNDNKLLKKGIPTIGYTIDATMKPIDPLEDDPESQELFKRHCDQLKSFIRKDLEIQYLNNRLIELKKTKMRKSYEEEYRLLFIEFKSINLIHSDLMKELNKLGKNKIKTSKVSEVRSNLIGSGAFGDVRKAIWHGKKVAVKEIKEFNRKNETFKTEINLLKNIQHENIIKIYHYNSTMDKILFEYAEGGCLNDVLHTTNVKYTTEHAFNWAYQIAKGISHLHQRNPPIIHRDIKPGNILLQDFCRKIKICDFGTAFNLREQIEKKYYPVGTVRWMAPEVISDQIYTEKCDVFSWAITFWEIISREIPYAELLQNQSIMYLVTRLNGRPLLFEECPQFLEKLIVQCWHESHENRPKMWQVEKIIKEFVLEIERIHLPRELIRQIDDYDFDADYEDISSSSLLNLDQF